MAAMLVNALTAAFNTLVPPADTSAAAAAAAAPQLAHCSAGALMTHTGHAGLVATTPRHSSHCHTYRLVMPPPAAATEGDAFVLPVVPLYIKGMQP